MSERANDWTDRNGLGKGAIGGGVTFTLRGYKPQTERCCPQTCPKRRAGTIAATAWKARESDGRQFFIGPDPDPM
jgi:hypothetical protein